MAGYKVVLVFGTRPEAIKMFPVVRALQASRVIETKVVVTAQHRALLDQVLELAGIVPDVDLDVMMPDQSLDTLTARLILALGEVLDAEQPQRVLVHGDTLSAMVGMLAAYYRRIPVGHVEAGLRSRDLLHPWPEEVNRRLISCGADLHFAPTQSAADTLRAEGHSGRIIVTGNTVVDALLSTRAALRARPQLASAVAPVLRQFSGKRLVLVTGHRRENLGEGMANIASAMRSLAARDDIALVYPVHPNPRIRASLVPALADLPNVALLEPVDYPSFVALLDASTLVLTDSGGVQEEAPALGKPVLVMRETTERPEGLAAGTARLVGTAPERIVSEVTRLLDDATAYASMSRAHSPFGDGSAAERIVSTLEAEARTTPDILPGGINVQPISNAMRLA